MQEELKTHPLLHSSEGITLLTQGCCPDCPCPFFHTHAGPWLTQKQSCANTATLPLLPPPAAPWKWYHLHPGVSIHIWVAANSLHSFKVQPTWEAEGAEPAKAVSFLWGTSCPQFPSVTRWWKHPWTHASRPTSPLQNQWLHCPGRGEWALTRRSVPAHKYLFH